MRALQWIAVWVALVGAGGGYAQPAEIELQAFSSLSRGVVAAGETFALEVEAVGALEGEAVVFDLADSEGALEVVRVEEVEAIRGVFEGRGVVVLGRRFVLRSRQAGRWAVPEVSVLVGAERAVTGPHTIHVYDGAAGVYAAARAVFPVVSEGDGFQRIGSAFLIAEDAVVTAYHVVVGASRVRLQLPNGQRLTTRHAWALDPVRDVAVLRVDPEAVRRAGVAPLALAPGHAPGSAGDPAFTAGWPDGVQRTSAGVRFDDLRPAPGEFTRVSSNAIRPGDSGGPLLDREGRVLGVVTSGRTTEVGDDVLAESVCLASDPRRALAQRLRQRAPHRLTTALAVHARSGTYARALDLATAVTRRGIRRAERADYVEALRLTAAEAPRDPALLFLLGVTLERVGDQDHAAAVYRAALERDLAYFPATYALGHYYMKREAYGHAEALFLRTRRGTPYATLASLGLAQAYAAQLRYAEAEAALRAVLRRDHRFAPALYLLGYCALGQGRRDEAGALLVRLEQLDAHWAERLRLHLRQPVLEPVALAALRPPPAP